MNVKIKIKPPKRLKTPYLNYSYVVYYHELNDDILKRKYFRDLNAAKEFYQTKKASLISQLSTVYEQSAIDIMEFRSAEAIAASYGLSFMEFAKRVIQSLDLLSKYKSNANLITVLKDYLDWRENNDPSITLSYALDAYIDMVKNSKKRLATKVSRILFFTRFRREFTKDGDIPLHSLTTKVLEDWLLNLKSIKHTSTSKAIPLALYTKHSYLVSLATFFNFCKKKGYLSRNPARSIELPVLRLPAPKAFTPDEIVSILKLFPMGSTYMLYVCIAGFSGIRPAEIGRLKWSDIDISERSIGLSGEITKMSNRRVVHIRDNLLEWLQLWKDKFGSNELVVPRQERIQWMVLKRIRTNLGKSIHDGLRHSFGTYLQALTNDCDYVAEQMGHTLSVFKAHYMDLVSCETAKQFFAITPKTILEQK